MPLSIDTISQSLHKLIRKFEADKAHYLSKCYKEAQARIDFITPFFKILGGEVENEAGLPHHDREVIAETSEEEAHGRPDYAFRIGGQTKFFFEGKAPSEPLTGAKHILQANGYAWNTEQVFLVIPTDFEEFRFYDASIQPDERKPDEGLLLTLKYTDYLKNVEKLWEFSKQRVAAGSLDVMLPRDRRTQRLRIPVDTAFLDEMPGWREDLAMCGGRCHDMNLARLIIVAVVLFSGSACSTKQPPPEPDERTFYEGNLAIHSFRDGWTLTVGLGSDGSKSIYLRREAAQPTGFGSTVEPQTSFASILDGVGEIAATEREFATLAKKKMLLQREGPPRHRCRPTFLY